jgi:hypothetical protein
MSKTPSISIGRLIFVPAVITLAITLLRLAGELKQWSPVLFNRDAGGPGAIIGISWLPFIFGIYFASKLSGAGEGPLDRGRAFRLSVIGLVLFIAGGALAIAQAINFPGKVVVALLVLLLAIGLQYSAWPKLFKTLVAYGYAARIPVVILMYFALRGHWQTHYDALPPNFPEGTSFWVTYFQIAFVPQMVLWIAFTIIAGALTGSITALVKGRKPAGQAANA